MKLSRRKFFHLAASITTPLFISRVSRAQSYPDRPVRLIVGGVPGGAPDVIARLIAQWLSERLGRPFVVENRTGASGNLAAEAVVRVKPDGYTLLLATVSDAINATLYNNLNFSFIHDIAPVAGVVRFPMVITVHSSFSAKTLPEFLASFVAPAWEEI